MDTFKTESDGIEIDITEFIKGKLNNSDWKKYVDEPIKDRVLELLNAFCIVVFYPLEEEKNNGFHITDMPFSNGTCKNFVYINTAQTTEKQVFTAAHELGHIWEVDNYMIGLKKYSNVITDADRESVINRFAAILLMPKESFLFALNKEANKYYEPDQSVTFLNLLKIIVSLMNTFFAPFKSVVIRMSEFEVIDNETKELLLGQGRIPQDLIDEGLQKTIADFGMVQFQNPTNKKYIAGFAEQLDEVEARHLVTQSKIENMRDLFDLKDNKNLLDMHDTIVIRGQSDET